MLHRNIIKALALNPTRQRLGVRHFRAALDCAHSLPTLPSLPFLLSLLFLLSLPSRAAPPPDLSLNGTWQTAINRAYDTANTTAPVPGLAQNPDEMSPGTLWYRRTVALPAGDWDIATLTLKGARFAPSVYVNGALVSQSEGGMAPTVHVLTSGSAGFPLGLTAQSAAPTRNSKLETRNSSGGSAAVAPGKTITLEIALKSLADLPGTDASSVPPADRWRSDISSNLWDDVTLHFSKTARIARLIPFTDYAARTLTIHYTVGASQATPASAQAFLLDTTNHPLAQSTPQPVADILHSPFSTLHLSLPPSIHPWTPDTPHLYRLRLDLLAPDGTLLDRQEIPYGFRDFRTTLPAETPSIVNRKSEIVNPPAPPGFLLNGHPIHLRAASVVWHRWLRDPEARTLAFDPAWFERNIVLRLKSLGANTLRFHLGTPPEALLDLCDRDGLLVQFEWPFFHGIKAAPASMTAQWRAWLDLAMRHPSVAIVHAWNETEGDELTRAWDALNAILPEYPPLVVGHRDTLHIHKYWWSLFENLGLYYDSATQFDLPIMVDEFGGNYLDGNLNPGAYPSVAESLLRFLGRDHTAQQRLRLQTLANARVAEYWRRLGAAGVAPFVALSSPEDGNHWFLGPLSGENAAEVFSFQSSVFSSQTTSAASVSTTGAAAPTENCKLKTENSGLAKAKPVWPALAAAFAPLSISLDIWDANFLPSQQITVPLHYFNETDREQTLTAEITIVADKQFTNYELRFTNEKPTGDETTNGAEEPPSIVIRKSEIVNPHATRVIPITLTLPPTPGSWLLRATLIAPQHAIPADTPITSEWPIRTLAVVVPPVLRDTPIGVPANESELRAFLTHYHLHIVPPDDPAARVIVTSLATAKQLAPTTGAAAPSDILHSTFYILHSVQKHQSLVLLDLGPRDLGQPGPLDGAPRIDTPKTERWQVLTNPNLTLTFTEAPEPESCIHPSLESDALWTRPASPLPRESTQLWNGLRGGLIVPASEMDVSGLAAPALLALWQTRGADPAAIVAQTAKSADATQSRPIVNRKSEIENSYYAYELSGYYAFSATPDDKETIAALRKKVQFLADDAPALQSRLNPRGPVTTTDLAQLYRAASTENCKLKTENSGGFAAGATRLTPLANAGKNLTRAPIVALDYAPPDEPPSIVNRKSKIVNPSRVILSQLLTAGRLAPITTTTPTNVAGYALRPDPAAQQLVLNLLAEALEEKN